MWGTSVQAEQLLASNEGLSYSMVFSQFIYLTAVPIIFILTHVSGFLETLVATVLSVLFYICHLQILRQIEKSLPLFFFSQNISVIE
jgi:heme O synthase-like polyprenyltransferase